MDHSSAFNSHHHHPKHHHHLPCLQSRRLRYPRRCPVLPALASSIVDQGRPLYRTCHCDCRAQSQLLCNAKQREQRPRVTLEPLLPAVPHLRTVKLRQSNTHTGPPSPARRTPTKRFPGVLRCWLAREASIEACLALARAKAEAEAVGGPRAGMTVALTTADDGFCGAARWSGLPEGCREGKASSAQAGGVQALGRSSGVLYEL